MANKSLKELKILLENDIEHNKKFMQSVENDQNPQVKEMYNSSKARVEAMQDVLEYVTKGSKAYFDGN